MAAKKKTAKSMTKAKTKKAAKTKAKKSARKPPVRRGKGSAARTAPKPAKPAPAGGGDAIRIRMYRVGFGDCFLVSIPSAGKDSHILVDCGVHARGDLKMMPTIVADIAQEAGKHLDLIIATHAHQDHVSGFSKGKADFSQFGVGEVWLPWTEDPSDPVAGKLRLARTSLALALDDHFNATGAKGPGADAVMNATGNADALALLKSGVNGGKVRYLKGGMSFSDAAGIKGLEVKVLGPPTDQKFLSLMNPPSGDRFMRLDANGEVVAANAVRPFADRWTFVPKDPPLKRAETKDLSSLLDDADGLAFTLDSVLNNTSIVALMTFGGKNLLFPGDAQYGNWQSWMETADGTSILSHIDYFKIAHHGSLNATPKSALDKTPDKAFAAQISTQDIPWPSIPFEKMLVELDQKSSGYVRSDSIPLPGVKGAPQGPAYKPMPGFELGPFWCDYHLAL